MKRSATFLVLLCLSLTGFAALAPAHNQTFGGNLSFSLGSDLRFRGNLNSTSALCERNRYINIYVKGADGTYGSASSATTKNNGSFVTGTGFYDRTRQHKATTPAKTVLKNGQHTHKCKAVTKILPGKED